MDRNNPFLGLYGTTNINNGLFCCMSTGVKMLNILKLFFASTFCRMLQVKNTECCIMENP